MRATPVFRYPGAAFCFGSVVLGVNSLHAIHGMGSTVVMMKGHTVL